MLFEYKADVSFKKLNLLMIFQFIYTTVVWAVVIGQKIGNSMIQLFTFFMSVFGYYLIMNF